MRKFQITYKSISKYKTDINRNTLVNLSKETGDIGRDAKAALNIFVSTVGNLKKYEIIEIQEINDKGAPIGEPIKPMGENTIIPFKK